MSASLIEYRGYVLRAVLASLVHFADNFYFIEQYGGPDWITAPGIIRFWIIMTVIGLASYKALEASVTKSPSLLFYVLSIFYAGCCMFSILHYAVNPPSFYPLRIHLLLWPEVLAGFTLLLFIIKIYQRSQV